MNLAGETDLANVIDRQFGSAWDLLEEVISAVPEDQWTRTRPGALAPARIAYHTIETVDYYARENLKDFAFGGRFGVEWESAPPERLPECEAVLAYLEDVRSRTSTWLIALGDRALLEPDAVFHPEGFTHLDRALYALRHTHQHVGELCAALRRENVPRPGWR